MARSWWVDYWRVKSKTLIQKKGKLKKTLLLLSIGKIPKKDKPKSFVCIYIYICIILLNHGPYLRYFPKSLLKSQA